MSFHILLLVQTYSFSIGFFNTSELTILSRLFEGSSINQLRVDFNLLLDSNNVSTSIVLTANQKPANGICSANSTQGIALSTNFNISCSNWIDPDGNITKYEFFGK